MNNGKSDYWKGLAYFFILMICILSWFRTPDREILLFKFIGLFGLSPGIQIGRNTTVYIYPLIPIIAAIVSIKKIFKYWQGYGLRFKGYNASLRFLPILLAMPVLLFSNIVSPSLLDQMYFAVISQRSGLRSVTWYSTNDQLSYEFAGNSWTFSYDFTFGNHGNETVEFNVKLIFRDMDGLHEVFIEDNDGELKIFSLPPRQSTFFSGEFSECRQTNHGSGRGSGNFSIVLTNGDEQYSPKPLTSHPLF